MTRILDIPGEDCSRKLQQALSSTTPGLRVEVEDPTKGEASWSQTLSLRKGLWVGVDIELVERDKKTQIEVSVASQGQTMLLLLAVVAALLGALVGGDLILPLVGLGGYTSKLTLAISVILFLFITVPTAMLLSKLLGKGGEEENKRLQELVSQLLKP